MNLDVLAPVGSPPQVRGKPTDGKKSQCWARITPAGAGKTRVNNILSVTEKDHPRRCGENDFAHVLIHRRIGSPPQVRGKRTLPPLAPSVMRITPAGAGKTL